MNKYLEKIAKDANNPDHLVNSALGGAGIYAMSNASDKALGYHVLYHGTSDKTSAKS